VQNVPLLGFIKKTKEMYKKKSSST
jgi:hypothetical protein